MSIFEYVCRECNHRFELLIQGSAEAACPRCRTAAEPAEAAEIPGDQAPAR